MKRLTISLLLFISIQLSGFGQIAIYDAQFNAQTDCKSINDYAKKKGVEIQSQHYMIDGQSVLEIYRKASAQIIGFVVDTSKVDIKELKYFKQDGRMNYLMSKYIASTAEIIHAGKVYIGMTMQEATDSWGNPQRKNKTTTADGTKEQWVYGINHYLYFEGGVLTTIQN